MREHHTSPTNRTSAAGIRAPRHARAPLWASLISVGVLAGGLTGCAPGPVPEAGPGARTLPVTTGTANPNPSGTSTSTGPSATENPGTRPSGTPTRSRATVTPAPNPNATPAVRFAGLPRARSAIRQAMRQAGSARFEITLAPSEEGKKQTMSGSLRYTPDGWSGEIHTRTKYGTTQAVFLHDVVYVKPPLKQVVDPSRPWVRLKLPTGLPLARYLEQVVRQGQQAAQPLAALRAFRAGVRFRAGKNTRIDGTATRQYRAVLDLPAMQPPPDSWMLFTLSVRLLEQQGAAHLTQQIWLTEQNLPLRLRTTLDTPGLAPTVTVRYSDYGAPVTITAPRRTQVGVLPSVQLPSSPPRGKDNSG